MSVEKSAVDVERRKLLRHGAGLWQVRPQPPTPKQEVALVGAYIQMWPVAMPADFLDGRKRRKG